MADVPVLGSLVQLINLRSYSRSWGDTGFNAVYPAIDTDKVAAYEKPSTESLPDGTGSTTSPSPSCTAPHETGSAAAQATSSSSSAASSGHSQKEPQTTQPPDLSQPSPSTEPSKPDSPAPTNSTQLDPSTEPPEPDIPTPPANITDGIEDMNQQIESYISKMREKES